MEGYLDHEVGQETQKPDRPWRLFNMPETEDNSKMSKARCDEWRGQRSPWLPLFVTEAVEQRYAVQCRTPYCFSAREQRVGPDEAYESLDGPHFRAGLLVYNCNRIPN